MKRAALKKDSNLIVNNEEFFFFWEINNEDFDIKRKFICMLSSLFCVYMHVMHKSYSWDECKCMNVTSSKD